MKVFNARAAAEEYMSTHSLTFSTPEMTLKKFALWLGEQVDEPGTKAGVIPRLVTYLEEKESKSKASFRELMPDIDETFKPSGAVTKMYGPEKETTKPPFTYSGPDQPSKICKACRSTIKANSKFCANCGTKQ
jgi:hypothetical protein